MQFYLFIPLFFLSTLYSPFSLFSQEEAPPQEMPSVHPTHLPPDQDQHELMRNHEIEHYPVEHESETFQTKFTNMLVILGLLIAFMILASWALKRMMRTRINQLNTASTIKVLETRNLSPRSTLYLIEVQGQPHLIAESHTAVTYLTALPLEEEGSSQPSPQPFSKP